MEIISEHLDRWVADQLLNPFAQDGGKYVQPLLTLHRHIYMLAEDYLSKPTSEAKYTNWYFSRFSSLETIRKQQTKRKPGFNMDSLKHTEKRRIFRTFLRHELLCKILWRLWVI